MKTDAKEYLEYLDKEMTIMGILSAVSLAAPAGILNTFMSDKGDLKAQIWEAGRFFVTAGSLLCVLAAFFFYMQRSRLAQFYGHICLVKALGEDPLAELLCDANSGKTYLPYCWGFTALVTGFIE